MRFLDFGRRNHALRGSYVDWRGTAANLLLALILIPLVFGATVQAATKFAAVTVDARNGKLLFSENADAIRHPASLTKMMTLYVLFQDLKAGKIKLDSPIRMSKRAASMAPSKLGVKPGGSISVETAIRALVVKSANDVAAAVAENLAGTESAFAQRMTRTARSIGMKNTRFANASGLPNPSQVTTARDMATLGLRLMRDFPQYYPYFRTQSFVYAGRTIRGHNRLLGKFDGTDGIKTGYINASGFNLVSSVRRGEKRLVGVVLGGRTGASRDAYMKQMLTKHFGKAADGKMIAAVAGSSKGAVDPLGTAKEQAVSEPVVAANEKGIKRPKSSIFGSKKKTEEPEEQLAEAETAAPAIETSPAAPEEGDTDEGETLTASPGEEPAGKTIQQVDVPAEQPAPLPQATTVVEANLSESVLPGKLPFQVKTPAEQLADQTAVASLPEGGTWSIQIGTFSTKKDAQAQLQRLRKALPSAFEGKTAQTVAVQKGEEVIYRARFTGYDETSAAVACKEVKKKKSACSVQAPL